MTGPKLNEGATIVGERSGTKATAKYVRSSARKARVVLDLIRGLDVRRADEVLQFTDRGIARDIRKVLASAVANAANNDGQDPDELYVIACFADEGPTLKRFRPRARGRASRIRKRTCHITVIVARMSDERLAVVQARQAGGAAGRPSSSAASRQARVERSRQRAQAAKEGVDAIEADETVQDADDLAAEADATAEVDEAVETDEAADTDVEAETAEVGDDTAGDAPYPGSALPQADGSAPEGFTIKGNADSMLYHEPGSRYYDITQAEVYFDSADSAEAAGFGKPGGSTAASSETSDDAAAGDDEETK
ncbi:MAG: 50S ribosomal protein L22 [Ilumatobacter sp.]|jgi:large subunit ribosomal protein L22|nr:MAG: 50S ribosomal protein L22 [Ilumatobacter sp.]